MIPTRPSRRGCGRRRCAAVAVGAALVATAACSGGGGGGGGGPAATKNLAAQCPQGAVAKAAQKPVQITMWHSMVQANLDTLQALTASFNASHPDIHVNLVNQTSYTDTLTKYKAALSSGARPDVVQIQDVDQQLVIDSRSILPTQACIDAEHVDQSDFVPRIAGYYKVRGVEYATPFSASNNILFYNKQTFVKAGLDPDHPPATLDELRAASQKIVSSGAARFGIALKLESWYLEQWLAMGGHLYADNNNGRDTRATAVVFDNPDGLAVFNWLSGMARDKLAEGTSIQQGFDNILAVSNGVAAMTISSSAGLGTIVKLLGGNRYKNVTLGVGRLPGPVANGPTVPAGSSLFVVANTSPEREEAAWQFTQYLTQPEQQAIWAAGTGYVPVRSSSATQPVLLQAWAKTPELKVAYDQLNQGANDPASEGPVIGDMEGVRAATEDAVTSIFQGGDPVAALHKASQSANEVIASYEARVAP